MDIYLAKFSSSRLRRYAYGLIYITLLAILLLVSIQAKNVFAAEASIHGSLDQSIVTADLDTLGYKIDSATSSIHVYTGTSGLLKSVSHRHLIAINNIQGDISWSKDNALNNTNAQASLLLKPQQFIVDGNAERKAAVDKRYRNAAPNWVKSGTRKNMLGKRFLNVEFYPAIKADIKLKSLEGEQALFTVTLNIIGNTKQVTIPAKLVAKDNTIHVSGDFKLNHTDLGLKRFKAAGGAASVAESLRFIININASEN